MLTAAFKTFGVLYLVMQQTIAPFNSADITKPVSHISNISILDKKVYYADLFYKDSIHNSRNKKEAKNSIVRNIPYQKPQLPTVTPVKRGFSPFSRDIPEPVITKTITTPTKEPIQHPVPSYRIPEVTIIPVPSQFIPCGCEPVWVDGAEIHCTMYTPDMLCPD